MVWMGKTGDEGEFLCVGIGWDGWMRKTVDEGRWMYQAGATEAKHINRVGCIKHERLASANA